MKIKLTEANARLIEGLFQNDHEIYINDTPIDYVYDYEGSLVVEIDGQDREIAFDEEIDVRIVQVIRNEVEVDFES